MSSACTVYAARSRKRLPTVSPAPLSPDTIAWNATCALADQLGAAAPDASVTAPATAVPDQPASVMDADDEEVVLQVGVPRCPH